MYVYVHACLSHGTCIEGGLVVHGPESPKDLAIDVEAEWVDTCCLLGLCVRVCQGCVRVCQGVCVSACQCVSVRASVFQCVSVSVCVCLRL